MVIVEINRQLFKIRMIILQSLIIGIGQNHPGPDVALSYYDREANYEMHTPHNFVDQFALTGIPAESSFGVYYIDLVKGDV
jgi:hypothetical protein